MPIRDRKEERLLKVPATDDALMDDTPPGCSFANFKRPKLRRCPYDINSVIIRSRQLNKTNHFMWFDGGLDGFNYKISFQKGGPVYVMKVLWDTKLMPPHYFAPQRECQNAALFQMMQAAVSAANTPTDANTPAPGPILINPNPKNFDDAFRNYIAFSDEVRAKRAKQLAEGVSLPDLIPLTEMPRMRRCYGWMRFRGQELADRLPRGFHLPQTQIDKLRRDIQQEDEYTAIIYEYIEQGANNPEICQPVLDFLWRASFQFVPITLEKNWQSSILLDHAEIVHCLGYGWDLRWEREWHKSWRSLVSGSGPPHGTTIPNHVDDTQDQDPKTGQERCSEATRV